MMTMRKFALILSLLLAPLTLLAQRYIMLSVPDGLSSSNVNALYQDSRGDIWIATDNGVSRYDGLEIRSYKHDPADPHSIAHNIVRAFAEDGQGRLLVGGQRGVQFYDPRTDSFSTPLETEPGVPYTGMVNHMVTYNERTIWMSGDDLLKVVSDPDEPQNLVQVRIPIPTRGVGTLQMGEDGTVWCARHGDGIYKLNTGGFWSLFHPDNFEDAFVIISNSVDGVIYAADHSGNVSRYDPATDRFVAVPTPGMKGLRFSCILNDGEGNVMFGTDGNGIRVLNTATGTWSLFRSKSIPCDPATMSVHSILKDRDGNLWLAAYQRGVIMIPAGDIAFHYIGSRSFVSDVIGSQPVSSLLAERDGKLWVGTQGDGLYLLDADLSQLKHYSREAGFPDAIFDLTKDRDGKLWFGSYEDGLWRLDPERGQLVNTATLNKEDHPASIPRSIALDRTGLFWIGAMGYGLFCYDPVRHRTVRPEIQNETVNPRIADLLIRGNNLYIATARGIYHLDVTTQPLSVLHHALPDTQVYALAADGKNLYACTLDGLAILDPSTLEATMLTKADGLPDNAVFSIEIGPEGELWFCTGTRLVRYDPNTRSLGYAEDDLLVGEFLRKVSAAGPDGRIFFGGTDGVTCFKPADIRAPGEPPHAKIVAFAAAGNHITPREDGTYVLPHTENSCTVYFTTEEFDSPSNLQFRYTIDGKNWTKLPRGQTSVTLGNLKPGRYKFSVKTVFWKQTTQPTAISIRVLPSWWGSAPAIGLYLLVGLLLLGIIAFLLRHVSLGRKELARYAREQSAKEEKLHFFLSLSHEIRSPMTLVKAPLQKLIETDPDPQRQRVYADIGRNADTVLQLLDQTMDISKADEGAMKLSFAPVELVQYVSDVCDLFRIQAEHNGQRLAFRYACARDLEVWLDPSYFNKVIANLLSNALKYTPRGGNISVTVSAGADTASVEVRDNGKGLDEAEIQHIFNLFYQSQGAVSGTGVGLYFAKAVTELHHGTIKASNNPDGGGSVFTVTLPLGNAHLSDEQIKEREVQDGYKMDIPVPQITIQDEEEPQNSKGRERHTLLIVDDNNEIRHWLANELASEYRILEAENGKNAYTMALSEHPDLLISDVIMPGMDGFELCEKIRKNPNISTLPVILLTARIMDQDKIEGIEAGADAYMTKPFNLEVLRTTVENLIKGRERLKVTLTPPKVDESDIREVGIKTPDDRLLERIVRIVNEHLGDPELTVEQVAGEVGISRVHLHRKLKELTGQTSRDFIRNLRLKKAAEMLAEKKYAISELADAVGFLSASSFTTAFKTLYGVSPSEYGQQQKGM